MWKIGKRAINSRCHTQRYVYNASDTRVTRVKWLQKLIDNDKLRLRWKSFSPSPRKRRATFAPRDADMYVADFGRDVKEREKEKWEKEERKKGRIKKIHVEESGEEWGGGTVERTDPYIRSSFTIATASRWHALCDHPSRSIARRSHPRGVDPGNRSNNESNYTVSLNRPA